MIVFTDAGNPTEMGYESACWLLSPILTIAIYYYAGTP